MSLSTLTIATVQRSSALSSWERIKALAFPHAGLWAVALFFWALDYAVIELSPDLSIRSDGFNDSIVTCTIAAMLVAWRYWRFKSFDWFLHRIWCLPMLMLWIFLSVDNMGLFSHLLFRSALPTIDAQLLAIDRSLGFDWNAYARLITENETIGSILATAYHPFTLWGLIISAMIATLLDNRKRVIEITYLMTVTAFVAMIFAAALPAYPVIDLIGDPALVAGLKAKSHYFLNGVSDELNLYRDLGHLAINPDSRHGLISFPSYHTCMAIIIIYCSRGHWFFSVPGSILGIAIIVSTPVFGGHYLSDVLGGLAVSAFCIFTLRKYVAPKLSADMPCTGEHAYALPDRLKFWNRFKDPHQP